MNESIADLKGICLRGLDQDRSRVTAPFGKSNSESLACWDFLAAAPIKFLPILQSLSPRIQASLTRRAVGNTCARVVYKYVASCDGADTCVWRGN